MSRCKGLKVVEGDTLKLDRLTDLPINVKHQIQEHLSIEEAAKMSVLSKPWRHVWASIPKLLFSDQFCNNKPSHKLIDIVDTILSQHLGAIKTFVAYISSIPSSQHSVIHQWMLLLSRNGLVDLTLHSTLDAPYNLPSYIYSVELQSLELSNCIFRPPSRFRGFPKLKRLLLRRVSLELDVATSFLWMPNLKDLRFILCDGNQHLKVYAPELLILSFCKSGIDTLQLGHFMDCQKLEILALVSLNNQDKAMKLTNFLSGWPKVRNLHVDSYYLKCVAFGAEEESLNFLTGLNVCKFNFADEDQIASLLRVLRRSPYLDDLLFSLSSTKEGEGDVHFEGPTYWKKGLNKLQKFEIHYFQGSKTELLFVRFILASAPLLLKATLLFDGSVDERQHLKISKELMGLHRASPNLDIICEPLKKTKRVLH